MLAMNSIDPVSLEIFKHLFASVAEEMGVTLGRSAYSPNIKERLDFSCALFDGDGRLLAQAAHIPVHLGAMPASVQAAIDECAPFSPGDVVILNDPYLGGTHLPDITMISPVYVDADLSPTPSPSGQVHDAGEGSPSQQCLAFFVASRAHHADVGGMAAGSMPLATEIYQEGLIIPPIKLYHEGVRNEAAWRLILRNVRTPQERRGDLAAQLAAHEVGMQRAREIVSRYSLAETLRYGQALISYAERLTRDAISRIPNGIYTYEDVMDDDGFDAHPLRIRVAVTVQDDAMHFDFSGSASAARGSINAVQAIVEAAVYYVVRCLVEALLGTESRDAIPTNAGTFAPLSLHIPPRSLLNAHAPHAVAGGNVETSQRVVDVVLGALAQALPDRIPAASQGTMNNVTFGGTDPETGEPFAYYETVGGGAGGAPNGPGESGIHTHMTNTLNTPVEALEYALPIRVIHYGLRSESGGSGKHRGGDGLRRDIQFLSPIHLSLLSERRRIAPYGLAGGQSGRLGRNVLVRPGSREQDLPGKTALDLASGDILSLRTPGGGGWGKA
jgi:N-methylhydantoinase B